MTQVESEHAARAYDELAQMSSTSTAPPPPVESEMADLAKAVDVLQMQLSRIEDRLTSVLGADPGSVPTAERALFGESNLAKWMSAVTSDLEAIGARLARLTDRVEV